MGKYKQLIQESIADAINRIFPYEKDETKSFGFYLEPESVERLAKLSYFGMFLSFNIGTGLTMGFQPDLLIPTGLNPNRFAFIVFLGSFGYFKYSDKIYESAYRTCYEMELVDRNNETVINRVDPNRNREVLEAVEDICSDALNQVEDTKTRTTIEEVKRRIKTRFEGEEYVRQH